jgi:hypothetical protein
VELIWYLYKIRSNAIEKGMKWSTIFVEFGVFLFRKNLDRKKLEKLIFACLGVTLMINIWKTIGPKSECRMKVWQDAKEYTASPWVYLRLHPQVNSMALKHPQLIINCKIRSQQYKLRQTKNFRALKSINKDWNSHCDLIKYFANFLP